MIRFQKGAVNQVTVTLTENSTLADPIYLFKFVNQQTAVNYYFIATDTSQYKERFNEFEVEEKTGANTLAGEVSIGNEGFYNYYVYETSLSSLSGLSTAEDAVPYIVTEVENGLVWAIPQATDIIEYEVQNTSIVYQPIDFDYVLLESVGNILLETGYLIELE